MNEPAVYLPPDRPMERVEEPETFTSDQVVAMTGVTYRQLDWWARNDYIEGQGVGPGSGRQRKWSREHVLRVIEIRDAVQQAMQVLADAGLPADHNARGGRIGNPHD